ncbi:MAG: hypothetical protein V4553_17675 [Bacteroidota bacterium]
MKRNNRTPYWWFIPAGLLFNAGTLFIHRYHPLSDFLLGALQGIGLALMLVALFKGKARRINT